METPCKSDESGYNETTRLWQENRAVSGLRPFEEVPVRAKPLPDVEYLRECFDYDPKVGILFWKARPRRHFPSEAGWIATNARFAGKRAGCSAKHRDATYIVVGINGEQILAHRIIWKMATGDDVDLVDHQDRDGENNRWINLRPATTPENHANSKRMITNTSGFKGVRRKREGGKFSFRVNKGTARIYRGDFNTAEEAHAAYCEAAQELFGEFWRPG
jgi:hypothetical protein